MSSHEFYMRLALENARAMKGQTDPNPLVGSVIVNENRIVGIGVHMKAGEPHAEIHAIRMAGEKAAGGTIYVTLEPCSHYGRTGPCAVAIVKAGLKKVVVAALDPNPLVAGRGIAILREAGIEVEIGICEEESRQMNEVFNKYIVKQIPFVTLKSGTSLDGKTATHARHSKWITSTEAREDVHRLRNENSAILVGVNTVIHDNPELTTRIPNGRNPIRVVLDSTLRIPVDSKLVVDQQAPTWIFTSKAHDVDKYKALEAAGVHMFVTSGSRVNLQEVMHKLGEKFVSSLLIEGGSEVNGAFLENRLVDKLVLYMAPKLIGGKEAPGFFGGRGFDTMNDVIELSEVSVSSVGRDIKIIGYPVYKEGEP